MMATAHYGYSPHFVEPPGAVSDALTSTLKSVGQSGDRPSEGPKALQADIKTWLARDPENSILENLYQQLGVAYYRGFEQYLRGRTLPAWVEASVDWDEVRTEAIEALQNAMLRQTEAPVQQAISLSWLAQIQLSLNDFELAEAHLQQALELRQTHLGPQHLDTAKTLEDLAEAYFRCDRHDSACHCWKQALGIYEAVLGSEHIAIAKTLQSLAVVYSLGTRFQPEAKSLAERALSIYEKCLGAEHPSTAIAQKNLTQIWQDRGDS